MSDPPTSRLRREPPRFRRAEVRATTVLGPRMVRVTLAGPELVGFAVAQPAASVRLLLPSTPGRELVLPAWTGNEFLLPDGARPTIRTLTPRRADPPAGELDVDVVLHDGGVLPAWASGASPGDQVAVSGPGRGFDVDAVAGAPALLLAGDETAVPAIEQLQEVLPRDLDVRVRVEVTSDALVAAVVAAVDDLPAGARIWAAGEAAAMQRIRRHLFEERGIPRSATTIRGYWKAGRAGGGDDER